MVVNQISRGIKILKNEGSAELARRSKDYLRRHISAYVYLRLMLRIKYGEVRPTSKDLLFIDPTRINYRIGNKYLPDNRPPYGVIDGNWDLKKSYWTDSHFYGLVERYKNEKKWEETIYYQTGINRLKSGNELGRLEGSQTVSNFKNYLDEIDNLYQDIVSNGYHMGSHISVNIGREGEFIVDHGHHRHTIARIAEVKEIPVRVKYRHKCWQEVRMNIYKNGFSENHDELREHPDLQDIHD